MLHVRKSYCARYMHLTFMNKQTINVRIVVIALLSVTHNEMETSTTYLQIGRFLSTKVFDIMSFFYTKIYVVGSNYKRPDEALVMDTHMCFQGEM